MVQLNMDCMGQNLHFFCIFFHLAEWKPLWSLFPCEKAKTRRSPIKGLRIARNCAPINHLLLANDLLLFGKASISKAACFKSCLDNYCCWSGQSINASKPSIHFSSNTNPAISAAIKICFPFNENPPKSHYLGLPIFLENSKRRGFQGIIDKVHSRIDGWRAKTLSQASKLVLLKSVAVAIPTYAIWNIPMMQSLFDSASTKEILKINFTSHSETKFIWTHSSKGEFSAKSSSFSY
jgi:hypothetical protein